MYFYEFFLKYYLVIENISKEKEGDMKRIITTRIA